MKQFIQKTFNIKLLEFTIVAALILFFCSNLIFGTISLLSQGPDCLDQWFFCYRLENQITRILGLNPGGIWEGGIFYPFDKVSILFDEPTWGVSLLFAPLWLFTKNIFLVLMFGGIAALFLSWIFTYYLVKSLGANRLCAFYASAMFCLSSISLSLILLHTAFWSFFLLPLLGLITVKIFSTSKISWGILWGVLFGYLAWSSVHLFVMGGLFLCLFISWNILFTNHSKKTLQVLLVAFVIAAIIAGAVLVPMYLTYQKFGFARDYKTPFLFASNWDNLICRSWPDTPFNLITKTDFWKALSARGEMKFGISIFLLLGALGISIIRIKKPVSAYKLNKFSKYTLGVTVIVASLLAFLNMHVLALRFKQWEGVSPNLATGLTYLYYILTGLGIYILRHRIRIASKYLDFFLLLCALLFGLLAFGPYYLTANKSVVTSPIAFLQYQVLGLSGIRATSRWGLLLSFTLAISVALFVSRYAKSRRSHFFAAIFMLISFLEVCPGVQFPDLHNLPVYRWTPRATDVFLKNLPGGALLEMSAYPVEIEHHLNSDNSSGYILFSRLYHKKPLVTGYASFIPLAMGKRLFCSKDGKLSLATIEMLRKFGAKYWVFHIDGWPKAEIQLLKDSVSSLRQIGELDSGKTLIYEDPDPRISVGVYDVI